MHEFKIFPSRTYKFLFSIIIIATCAVVIFLSINILLKLFLLLIIILYSAKQFSESVLLSHKNSIHTIYCNDEKAWSIATADTVIDVELCHGSTVTAYVCVLVFKCIKTSTEYNCVLFRDSLKHDEYRKLMPRLRFNFA